MSSMPTLKPRLVHLVKQPGVVSFGFNVTATRSEPCRYVGIVVDNSLAKQAGLRSGDRVHEVNATSVDGVPLQDIQRMIAKGSDQVQLLVADPMTDQLYRDNNEIIRCGLPETIYVKVPDDERPVYVQEQTNIHEEEDQLPVPPPIITQDNGISSYEPSPFKARLCTIKKWPDYQGYGFVLHGDKVDPGQTIGKIEPASPAEAAGVRAGDKLIEVNDDNVENEFQNDVVRRIANSPVPGQVTMLLVDPDALRFFKGHGMTIHSSMVDIERIETPPRALAPAASMGKVRLCHVKKWPDFTGFGFVLHGEKGVPGTYLTDIDSDSPAEAAGLQNGDRIIEINGSNVEVEEQPQAINRIMAGVDGDSTQTRLLVVDPQSDQYYKRQNILISGSMADVVYMTNPERQAAIVIIDPDSDSNANQSQSSPKARLSIIKKWSNFDGYGFYLHQEDGDPATFIGKVDPDSPAEAAGLRTGDRIIEVNGQNVEQDSQSELVGKVIAEPSETRLLVVDNAVYQYFLQRGVLINSNMTDVDTIIGPER